jgi:hypothetical protein
VAQRGRRRRAEVEVGAGPSVASRWVACGICFLSVAVDGSCLQRLSVARTAAPLLLPHLSVGGDAGAPEVDLLCTTACAAGLT